MAKDAKAVVFIPIKMNSERVKNKNIRPFSDGTPLIRLILDTILQVPNVAGRYVYCSDEAICEYLPQGIEFVKRDPRLDLSTTPFNEVLIEFAKDVPADVYALTHSTAPFIHAQSIEKGIDAVCSGDYDSALTVAKIQEFLWKDGKPFNYDVNNIPRTQDLEPLFTETCGLFVYRHDLITNQKRRIGDKPYLIELDKIQSVDINEPDDFLIADAIYTKITKERGRKE